MKMKLYAAELVFFVLFVSVSSGAQLIAREPTVFARSVYAGGNLSSNVFYVWNYGTGTLNYALSTDAGWLTVDPASGSSTGEHDRVQINYQTAALAVGSYTGQVIITSADATNSPQMVRVTLKVLQPLPPPYLMIYPTSLASSTPSGTNAPSQAFYMRNGSTGTLDYAISTDAAWLTVDPTSGTCTSRMTRIQVNFASEGLEAGSYTGLISIVAAAATNSPQTVRVLLKVYSAKTLAAAPALTAADVPRITRFEMLDQQLARIEWTSTSNQTYTLLKAYNLSAGFQVVASGLAATPPLNVYYDYDAGDALYYRVAVEQK